MNAIDAAKKLERDLEKLQSIAENLNKSISNVKDDSIKKMARKNIEFINKQIENARKSAIMYIENEHKICLKSSKHDINEIQHLLKNDK